MTHPDITGSGLAGLYDISANEKDPSLARYIGRTVRYVDPDVSRQGTITRDFDFIIRETQLTHSGERVLRGYAVDRKTREQVDTFGHPICPEEVEMIVC